MSIGSPKDAPRRTDLAFLRHRSRPVAVTPAATQPSPPGPGAPAVAGVSYARGPRPGSPGRPRPPSDRDLPGPTEPAPATREARGGSYSGGSSLDLSTPPPAAPAPPSPVARSDPPRQAARRAETETPTILTPKAPTVTLTRIQSGVGVLTFEAVCSEAVGDLRLGCAYQLRGGQSSIVQHASGVTTAPAKSGRPIIRAERDRFEKLTVDLRQGRDIERLVIYAFSDSGGPLHWGGTLVARTFGDALIEVPLDRAASRTVYMLMSLYNIRGEFVLRAEMEEVGGSVHDACTAYGFDRIAWLDQRTPVV